MFVGFLLLTDFHHQLKCNLGRRLWWLWVYSQFPLILLHHCNPWSHTWDSRQLHSTQGDIWAQRNEIAQLLRWLLYFLNPAHCLDWRPISSSCAGHSFDLRVFLSLCFSRNDCIARMRQSVFCKLHSRPSRREMSDSHFWICLASNYYVSCGRSAPLFLSSG